MEIIPIQSKILCGEGRDCTRKDDCGHQKKFSHPCGNGSLCNKKDDLIHASNFFHPDDKVDVRRISGQRKISGVYGVKLSPNEDRHDSESRNLEEHSGSTQRSQKKPTSSKRVENLFNDTSWEQRRREEGSSEDSEDDQDGMDYCVKRNESLVNHDHKRRRNGRRGFTSQSAGGNRQDKKFTSFLNSTTNIPRGKVSRVSISRIPFPYEDRRYWKKVTKPRGPILGFYELLNFLESLGGEGTRDYENLKDSIRIFGKYDFYDRVLPNMIKLLQMTEEVFKDKPIYFMNQEENKTVKLSRIQCSVILANSFFSTFKFYESLRNYNSSERNCGALPTINFKKLFNIPPERTTVQKILCFLNYFNRVINSTQEEMSGRYVEFERKFEKVHDVFSSNRQMCKVKVFTKGKIEHCANSRQMDFANMYLGGGVLGYGAVQEEIRFCVNPECVVGLLFSPCLFDCEAIVIRGTERFSKYTGYGSRNFKYNGQHKDSIRDQYEICAMDALDFSKGWRNEQYSKEALGREIWKSYVAFKDTKFDQIATGHWGCGAFGGNKGLKFAIQWLSASAHGKTLVYYAFGDQEWKEKFVAFQKDVLAKRFSLKEMYVAIMKIYKMNSKRGKIGRHCLDIILKNLNIQRQRGGSEVGYGGSDGKSNYKKKKKKKKRREKRRN